MKLNAAAKRAIDFVKNLTLVGDASDKAFSPAPFQRDILATIFGKVDDAGKRKIKRVFLMLPRKQAKTYLVACIVLYWLIGRGLKGQQCLSIANDKAQAGLLFDMCRQMIEADPELAEFFDIVPSTKRITVPFANSFYAALSTEASTKTGFNPSLVIIDEAQDIRDAELVKNLTTGRTAREDYLTIFVGTAGKRKDTTFYAEYEYAKKLIAGIVPPNDEYAAWIFEATPEEAERWDDEKTWKRVMPAYGLFCSPAAVRSEAKLAHEMPHKKVDFLQYMLNVWQIYAGATWIDDEVWMKNARPPLGDAKEYFAGFDKASVRDTTSLVFFGKNSEGYWDVIPYVWVCEAQVEARQAADFSYKQWHRDGHLIVTPGEAQDEEFIARDVEALAKKYKIKQMSIDRAGTSWIGPKFQSLGLDVVAFGQGFLSMSEPIKEIERLALNGRLAHGGHPVLRWMVNNVRAVTDPAGGIKFSKKHSEEKIDGAVALACAVGVAVPDIAKDQFGIGQSVYETRGLLML